MEERDTLLVTHLRPVTTNPDLADKGDLYEVAKVPNIVHEIDEEDKASQVFDSE